MGRLDASSTSDTLRRDLRYAIRTCRRTPWFTFIALLTLAIGIGANTAMFSLLNAVLLKPLPYPDPSRIVWFLTTAPEGIYANASDAKFNDLRTLSSTFEAMSAFGFPSRILRSGDHFDDVIVGQVSQDFFQLFGAHTQLGRFFTSTEELPGGDRVAVISDALWRRQFQRADVIGHTLELDHQLYVIVGVMRPGFDSKTFTSARYADAEIWLPLPIDPASTSLGNRFVIAGRLRPTVPLAQAQARVAAATAAFARRFPGAVRSVDGATVLPLQSVLARHDRGALLVLSGAVGLVLLIACVNLANLLLARGTARAAEIAVRAALGASRRRIVQQLLTESILLAAGGAAMGFVIGRLAIDWVVHWTGPTITRIGLTGDGVPMDARVLAFTCAAACAAVALFGVAPALVASRVDLTRRLGEQAGRQSGASRRVGGILAAGEMAVAVVLLTAAMLLIRTFGQLGAVQPGFDPHNLLAVQVTTDTHDLTTAHEVRIIQNAQERLRNTPGVVDVTATIAVPFDTDADPSLRYVIEGRPLDGPYHGIANWRPVDAQYFDTLRIPLLRGRTFTTRDSWDAPPVAIINQSMADKWWPQGNAIGQRIIIGRGTGRDDSPREIVGVVASIRDESLDQQPVAANYVPIAQLPDRVSASVLGQLTWIIRTQSAPETERPRLVSVLQEANEGMPTSSLGDVDAIMARSTSHAGFRMALMSSFAGIAVLLAAIGVYGVVAYGLRQRTREIGIRLAIGADPRNVVRLLVFSSLRYSLTGVVVGVFCAAVAARALKALLFGITSHDPIAFTVGPVVLACVAVVAAFLPAKRAANIDPIVTLRGE